MKDNWRNKKYENIDEILNFSSESFFENSLGERETWNNWRPETGWKPFKVKTAVSQVIFETKLRYNWGDIKSHLEGHD